MRVLLFNFYIVFWRIMVTGHRGEVVLPGATLGITGGASLEGRA
jgi:hypothetical protein